MIKYRTIKYWTMQCKLRKSLDWMLSKNKSGFFSWGRTHWEFCPRGIEYPSDHADNNYNYYHVLCERDGSECNTLFDFTTTFINAAVQNATCQEWSSTCCLLLLLHRRDRLRTVESCRIQSLKYYSCHRYFCVLSISKARTSSEETLDCTAISGFEILLSSAGNSVGQDPFSTSTAPYAAKICAAVWLTTVTGDRIACRNYAVRSKGDI